MGKFPLIAALAALTASAGTAQAQLSETQFQSEVLNRLERIELLLSRGAVAAPPPQQQPQESRREAGQRGDVSAATNLRCGFSGADCVAQANVYCRRLTYRQGVPSRIETRGDVTFLVRVTCVD